jgi:Fic family protein
LTRRIAGRVNSVTTRLDASLRAGRYEPQPGGYRAFIPAPLPPSPAVVVDEEMMGLLSSADRALGRLDGVAELLPDADRFVDMYVRREAVLSSQIEGTQASLADLLEFEAERTHAGMPEDVAETSNYVAAMNHGLGRLAELPVSLRLVREIHARLLHGVRGGERTPGEFRTSQNWIGPAGCTLTEATFVPPPPGAMLDALGDFERFLHAESQMPVLIRVGLAHAQFETIHPFLDGNGRVGRLLITFLLCEREVLRRPLLYLSYFLKRHRTEYYDRLQAIRDEGAWEPWVKFFLRGVRAVSVEATENARSLTALREAHRALVMSQLGRRTANGLALLESLYARPYLTVSGAAETTGLSFNKANSLVAAFVELGLLREVTGRRRDRLFRYEPYLDVFRDPEDER